MYNLSSKFNTFYRDHVVLPSESQKNLIEKKNLNIKRLKEGLQEYNLERRTTYKLAEEPIIQGSVAMATVTKNESNDYDIDVAIVFEKDAIPAGTIATKKIVVEALNKKTSQFNVQPEARTNCVRIVYAEGYHIDFAIYRRFKEDDQDEYTYEHCGSEWKNRNPRAITKWFNEQNREHDYRLREVVRLTKMFCKSRPDNWINMPGGLILTTLSNENFKTYDRIDERFYYTLLEIKNRLLINKEILNPTNSDTRLKLISGDNVKMTNLYNRLSDQLNKLDILFRLDCTMIQAIEAWEGFFNHTYWTEQKDSQKKAAISKSDLQPVLKESYSYKETEEYIEQFFGVSNIQYQLSLDAIVRHRNKSIGWLSNILNRRELLLPGYELEFLAETDVPQPYEVFWKVKNEGPKAIENDCVRGQIFRNGLRHTEPTSFKGNHYVECYIVKTGVVLAKKRVYVPIRV